MALYPLTGIPSSWRVPKGYVEILFGQGAGSTATDQREICIVMPKLSTGTGTANVLYQNIKDASEIEGLGGAGSYGHRAAIKIFAANKNAKVSFVPFAETTGGSPVAAALTVTAATTPTGVGVARVWVCGEACEYGYTSSDTVTTIAAGLKASINAKTWLPVTADNASGVLTITAKCKGVSGGDGTSGSIRVHCDITAGTATTLVTQNGGVTDALGLGAATDGAEGTTTTAAGFLTALATLDNVRKYYIITSAWDSTSLGHLQTHLTNKSRANPGLRSVGIAMFPGALAAGQTLAIARNYERIAIALYPGAEDDPASIAGWLGGVRSLNENTDAAFNFAGYSDGGILPAFDPASWLDDTDQNDAINDGLTPIGVSSAGRAYLVMSCSTRSKDSAGTNDDFRATETHRVSTMDQCADEWAIAHAKDYQGKKLASDPTLANGKINTNAPEIPGVVYPFRYKPFLKRLIQDWQDRALIQDAQGSKDSLAVVRDSANSSRVEIAAKLRTIDHFHQATFRVSETSPG